MNDYDQMKEQTVEHFNRVFDNFTKLFGTDDFWIAGGSIRDFVQSFGDPKDYDIFVTCDHSFFTIEESLKKAGYVSTLTRENSMVYEKEGDLAIDLIKVELNPDKLIIDDFDLTCCAAQFGPDGFSHHSNFFKDVQEQVINLNNLKLPYYTYKRIAKHIRKGYSVEAEVLVRIMDFAVEEMDRESKAPESNSTESEKSSSL